MDGRAAAEAIRRVLAADCGCEPSRFLQDGVHVVEAVGRPGRRRFPARDPACRLVTTGAGVVVSCSVDRVDWARTSLVGLTRDEVFSAAGLSRLEGMVAARGQRMAGPNAVRVCTRVRRRPLPAGVDGLALRLYEGQEVWALYGQEGFAHALGPGPGGERPDVLACAAAAGGRLVAIAGVSADCEALWQVGVDVLAAWRGRGIGAAVVAAVTEAVLERGRLPYYACAVANTASARTAESAGYRMAWVEAYAREAQV